MSHVSDPTRGAADGLLVQLPELVVSAGVAGARLTIRLLRPAQLTLAGGRWCIVHDPVGLTGDRLLACVHQAVASQCADGRDATRNAGPACTLRWVLVRPSMGLVCAAADQLATRAWQAVPSVRRARRVAETALHTAASDASPHRPLASVQAAPMASVATRRASPDVPSRPMDSSQHRDPLPGVLLLSESNRADAVSHTAAARLVLRAVRQGWSVLAATRDAPAAAATTSKSPPAPTPPWRSHWMCERGVLVPCPPPALD